MPWRALLKSPVQDSGEDSTRDLVGIQWGSGKDLVGISKGSGGDLVGIWE